MMNKLIVKGASEAKVNIDSGLDKFLCVYEKIKEEYDIRDYDGIIEELIREASVEISEGLDWIDAIQRING